MSRQVGLKWRWLGSGEAGFSLALKPALTLPVSRAAALYRPVESLQLGVGVMLAAGVGGARGARALTVTAGLDWEF